MFFMESWYLVLLSKTCLSVLSKFVCAYWFYKIGSRNTTGQCEVDMMYMLLPTKLGSSAF